MRYLAQHFVVELVGQAATLKRNVLAHVTQRADLVNFSALKLVCGGQEQLHNMLVLLRRVVIMKCRQTTLVYSKIQHKECVCASTQKHYSSYVTSYHCDNHVPCCGAS